ncbi:MAG: hypothetical protein M3477_03225 [Gemmatimonadota bacterium]|nr:hypothetical protein [Gemmatimonadota bacterium]
MSTTVNTAKQAARVAREALDTPRLSLENLAEAAGASRDALEKYRLGPGPGRRMPEAVRLRLAGFLEGHARRLLELAEQLRNLTDG